MKISEQPDEAQDLRQRLHIKKEKCSFCGLPRTKLLRHISCQMVKALEKEKDFDTKNIQLKPKIDILLILIPIAFVVLTLWTLYVTNRSEAMVAEYPQGGWVLEPHLAQDTQKWITMWFNQELL